MLTPDRLMPAEAARVKSAAAEKDPESIPELSNHFKAIAKLVYEASDQGKYSVVYSMSSCDPWDSMVKALIRDPYFYKVEVDAGELTSQGHRLLISWDASEERARMGAYSKGGVFDR